MARSAPRKRPTADAPAADTAPLPKRRASEAARTASAAHQQALQQRQRQQHAAAALDDVQRLQRRITAPVLLERTVCAGKRRRSPAVIRLEHKHGLRWVVRDGKGTWRRDESKEQNRQQRKRGTPPHKQTSGTSRRQKDYLKAAREKAVAARALAAASPAADATPLRPGESVALAREAVEFDALAQEVAASNSTDVDSSRKRKPVERYLQETWALTRSGRALTLSPGEREREQCPAAITSSTTASS